MKRMRIKNAGRNVTDLFVSFLFPGLDRKRFNLALELIHLHVQRVYRVLVEPKYKAEVDDISKWCKQSNSWDVHVFCRIIWYVAVWKAVQLHAIVCQNTLTTVRWMQLSEPGDTVAFQQLGKQKEYWKWLKVITTTVQQIFTGEIESFQ